MTSKKNDRYPEGVINHILKRIGPIHTSFHEIVSDDLVIDIHHMKAKFFQRYEIIVTSGMSAKPMSIPPDSKEPRYAEMMAILPKGWPLTKNSFDDERSYWPIRLLKSLARFPHHNGTWLGFGHTMSNGSSEAETVPYADNTKLSAVLVLPPMSFGEKSWSFKRQDGEEVFFWSAVPIYTNELKFKMTNGVDPLLDLFDKNNISDRINPARPSVIPGIGVAY